MAMNKLTALLAASALALSCLAGCGAAPAPAPTPSPTPAAETEPPAEETPVPELTPAGGEMEQTPQPTFDYDLVEAKNAPDTVVMSVGSVDVDWADYFSALASNLRSMNLYYGITDLTMEMGEDENVGDWLREMTERTLTQHAVIYNKAAELGYSLTEADTAAVDEEINTYAAMYFGGDKDALFREMGISEDYYRFQAGAAQLYDKLFAHFYGEGGSKLPDGDVAAYIADNELLYAQHILFKTVSDAGDKLDDETVAERKAAAEETLARLQAAAPEERAALFRQLMEEKSEDTGLRTHPDGYFFKEGEMVTEFYDAAKALEVNEISPLVESGYGYHILYRPAVSGEAVYGTDSAGEPYTLRYYVANTLFNNMMNEWLEAAQVRYGAGFEKLDVAALFADAVIMPETTPAPEQADG